MHLHLIFFTFSTWTWYFSQFEIGIWFETLKIDRNDVKFKLERKINFNTTWFARTSKLIKILFESNKGECYFKIIGIWNQSNLQKTSIFAIIKQFGNLIDGKNPLCIFKLNPKRFRNLKYFCAKYFQVRYPH